MKLKDICRISLLTLMVTAPPSGLKAEDGTHGSPQPEMQKTQNFAGDYLASYFAQNHYDWRTANSYLNNIIQKQPENTELVRRSMILATGSGDMEMAARRAEELIRIDTGDGLAIMILTVKSMADDEMDKASHYLEQMESGDMTDFIRPILNGWIEAGKGNLVTEGFNTTTIHNYHGGLLSVFLDRREDAEKFADALIDAGTLSNTDAERAADLLALVGRLQEAQTLYEGILIQDSTNARIKNKLSAAKGEGPDSIENLSEANKIKTAQQGAALAMYDMAFILYQEHSDSSTKLFSHMALTLDPDLGDAYLLLSDTLSRNNRFEEAIAHLANVPEDHPAYMEVQRHMAELMSEAGYHEEALQQLNDLFIKYNDVESLIRIGDLHRQEENFRSALLAYNKAAGHIGENIPEEYWYLLYARGMAYEREGDWIKAESDLKAALVYKPNHPYLLNYLGYGWADQGMNLEESLKLIKQAVELRPHDGYIIDSLGWAQYMMGDYEAALPSLEKAVELLPYDATINDHLGDVYWRVGRRTEARFQWERALNYGDDQTMAGSLRQKLKFGLEATQPVKQAGAAEQ